MNQEALATRRQYVRARAMIREALGELPASDDACGHAADDLMDAIDSQVGDLTVELVREKIEELYAGPVTPGRVEAVIILQAWLEEHA